MKVVELHAILDKLIKKKQGEFPIAIQRVEQGVTFAEHIEGCDRGARADGQIVWLYAGDKEPPSWAKGFNIEAALADMERWAR